MSVIGTKASNGLIDQEIELEVLQKFPLSILYLVFFPLPFILFFCVRRVGVE